MPRLWVLKIARGHDYEFDFGGVFDVLTVETLAQISPTATWRIRHNQVLGYNPTWADKSAAEFIFDRVLLNRLVNEPQTLGDLLKEQLEDST